MQAPYNDRWERTKRHLLRNFLVNPGFPLTPIPEEERSSPDSGSLPDLVLEPAPDRHDHPPDFYEGLERRMKRYYRQLFLGESDDDSSDFEVNRSMASTFILYNDDRKDNDANVLAEENSKGDLDDPIAKKRKLTKSTNESLDDENESQAKYDDGLFDTCASYNHTRHVSADSKSSSVEDEENLKLIEYRSINESIQSYKSDDPNHNIDDYGDQTCDKDQPGTAKEDRRKKRRSLNEISFETNETKSDSDEAGLCHRISTTVAEIHEERPRRRSTQVFGSPVLIPRLIEFNRSVFGSRKSGESFNVSEAREEFIRRHSSRKSYESNKHDDDIEEPETQVQRLLAASELTRASLDSDKLDTEHIAEYIHLTQHKNQEDDVDKNYNVEDRTDFEDIIQPHEITRVSLTSTKPLDTENIEDHADIEEDEQEKDDTNGDIEDRSGIEDAILPHEMTRASLTSNKPLDTENIEDHADTEEDEQEKDDTNGDIEERSGIEDIIQPHEMTRASLASNNKRKSENIEVYADTKRKKQEYDKTYDVEDKRQVSEIQTDNEGDEIDTDVDNESDITGIENNSINWNKDGIDDEEDSFEKSVRRGVFARKARKMIFVSSSDESFDEMEPVAQSSGKSIDDEFEEVEVMREAREVGGDERWSWHVEAGNQDSPALAFEAQTNPSDKSENDSSNSTKINASFEEIENDTEDRNTDRHYVDNIIDEFCSVSPEDVDIESPKEVSRSNKRRTDSKGDLPSKRKKKDIAIQTDSEDNCRKWEDVRSEFFVGTPLIFRLCVCQDHVCS